MGGEIGLRNSADRLHCLVSINLYSPIRWEIMGNIIFIKKLFIYFYTFIYFQRASEFFPQEEGTRKSFSVADGLTRTGTVCIAT